jgi:glucose-6-phosphate-specific signal transduction histidine kinase
MSVAAKWKQAALLVAILVLGYMPVLYGTLSWWPHDRWARILSGPVAVVASALLVGLAVSRSSKWWLCALIAPLFGIVVLLTASV